MRSRRLEPRRRKQRSMGATPDCRWDGKDTVHAVPWIREFNARAVRHMTAGRASLWGPPPPVASKPARRLKVSQVVRPSPSHPRPRLVSRPPLQQGDRVPVPPADRLLFAGPWDDPDRYQLLERRSSGGEGHVWLSELPIDSIRISVALKEILPENVIDLDAWRQRWRRQLELLRTCEHPGLVRVRDVFDGPLPHHRGDPSGESLYLAMEWVDGLSMEKWISLNPKRTVGQVLDHLERIGDSIDYLHNRAFRGKAILHRDIKPANILLSPTGPRLVDFGFARVDNTSEMTLVGTLPYLAPEVFLHQTYDAATDRFAFGGTTYFAFTGEHPPLNDHVKVQTTLASLNCLRDKPEVVELVAAMMAPNPADRPGSCADWVTEVRRLSGDPDTSVNSTVFTRRNDEARGRRTN